MECGIGALSMEVFGSNTPDKDPDHQETSMDSYYASACLVIFLLKKGICQY